MADYKKLGFDRTSMNISNAVDSGIGTGGLITGDITRGEVVELELTADTTASTTIKERRVGALELGRSLSGTTFITSVTTEGGQLTLVKSNAITGTITYWVF
jgi:hypothetical protein